MKKCDQEEWPECSGDPAACPENGGYGCGGGRAGDKPVLTLVEPDDSAESCGCASWCQNGGKFLASHHLHCQHYDPEGDAHKIITDLLRGIEASAQDTDGIHPALWEAYKRGKASVWEFDWKESDDCPQGIRFCEDCGEVKDNEFMSICKPCSIKRRDARLSSQNTD